MNSDRYIIVKYIANRHFLYIRGIVLEEFERLRQVIKQLRSEDGCPWDRGLQHEDLKATCIEEAAEVICGINILRETGDPESLLEELGDLLLQVLMHVQIAEEEGLFTLEDVAGREADKMIRRHPHVFPPAAEDVSGNSEVQCFGDSDTGLSRDENMTGSSETQLSWDEIKKREKAGKEWMDAYLPGAMLEARELVDRAMRRKGFLK